MKHACFKAFAATGAAALLLTACDSGGSTDDDGSGHAASQNPVYTEMSTWDACEVLDDLQPITDYMDIKGYGSSTSEGGEPGSSKLGNTFDPDAIGCSNLIYLGSYEGMGMSGEIKVKIVPTENENQASAAYEERVASAESKAGQGEDAQSQEFGDPWDQGKMVSWVGDAEQPQVEVIGLDGQWVFHIQLYHSTDFGLYASDEAALSFAVDERNQWLVDTYLPETNQIVNDRIAEVQ
ncbi:MAG TPA: hypothetical protein VFU12_17260 [Glycomyces sp.]|nr:hypothetical protein [Glycomyces sp.]